jgi:hypothetical protein
MLSGIYIWSIYVIMDFHLLYLIGVVRHILLPFATGCAPG